MILRTTFFCFLLSALMACQSNESSNGSESEEAGAQLSEEFTEFYEKFHKDSTYQMAHITFPLQGVPVIRDSIPEGMDDFKWERETWVIHKPFDLSEGSFERQMYLLGEDELGGNYEVVVEKIVAPSSGFGMERRFAKLQGEWYLIYYAAMNRM